jgi:hypothetical protein
VALKANFSAGWNAPAGRLALGDENAALIQLPP